MPAMLGKSLDEKVGAQDFVKVIRLPKDGMGIEKFNPGIERSPVSEDVIPETELTAKMLGQL